MKFILTLMMNLWLSIAQADENLSAHFDCLKAVFFNGNITSNISELSGFLPFGKPQEPKTYLVSNIKRKNQDGFYVFSRDNLYYCPKPEKPSQNLKGIEKYNVHLSIDGLPINDIIFNKTVSSGEFTGETNWHKENMVMPINIGSKDCIKTEAEDLKQIHEDILARLEEAFSSEPDDQIEKICRDIKGANLAITKGKKKYKPTNPQDWNTVRNGQ